MATKPLPDIDTLHQLLRYEPETGKLFWKERYDVPPGWNTRWAGNEAFATTRANGYKQGQVLGFDLLAHRVIMAMATGEWPPEEVDHINGVRDDNRLSNLRLATRPENARNKKLPSSNSSGCIGVSWDEGTHKWRAQIRAGGRKKHIGRFTNKAEAIAARKAAEAELGYHENHGR